jgi:hypothetical protein
MISGFLIKLIKNEKLDEFMEYAIQLQNKRVGNYILFQQEITSRGCKPSILEM